MQPIEISPVIPAAISRLPELASNLSFSWHRPTRALFEDLDPQLWQQTSGNPRLMLRCVGQDNLERVARDEAYLLRYRESIAVFDSYLATPGGGQDEPLIAYFCAEYGFHESFPIYSGGLGILAGDHCKSASDERLNFIAVGLLYRQGYFTQSVDSDGVQHALYRDADPRDLPVEPVMDRAGQWLKVTVPIANHEVNAKVWCALVGRVRVYLLDTNCPENSAEDRDITFRLYGGDERVRIRQEMVLGIGGARALKALGLTPAVWHINEGHAAFLILERLREQLARGLSFDAGLEAIAAQSVFTTHTPVAAGHDKFPRGPVPRAFRRPRALDGARGGTAAAARTRCERARPLQHDEPRAERHAPRQRREPHPRRRVVAAVRRALARDPAGREPDRLRDERRARADVHRSGVEPIPG